MSHRLFSIAALIPGTVLLGLGLLLGGTGWLTIPGSLLVGFSIGNLVGAASAVARVLPPAVRTPEPARQAVTAQALEDLELRAKVRGDFDTAGLVDRLQTLDKRLRDSEGAAVEPEEKVLVYKLRKMYDNAGEFCGRTLALHLARREMTTDEARSKIDNQRQALLAEIRSAVSGIETAIDRLRASAAVAGDARRQADLADLSKDLDHRLEVARRVEARMNELEPHDLTGKLRE